MTSMDAAPSSQAAPAAEGQIRDDSSCTVVKPLDLWEPRSTVAHTLTPFEPVAERFRLCSSTDRHYYPKAPVLRWARPGTPDMLLTLSSPPSHRAPPLSFASNDSIPTFCSTICL